MLLVGLTREVFTRKRATVTFAVFAAQEITRLEADDSVLETVARRIAEQLGNLKLLALVVDDVVWSKLAQRNVTRA